MACNCHGKHGISVTQAFPFDQCTACARKHVKAAWSKWNELSYEEDNRDYCSAQLRDAADHLKFEHRDIALELRDLALSIEEHAAPIREIADKLDTLRIKTRDLFFQDHPELLEQNN